MDRLTFLKLNGPVGYEGYPHASFIRACTPVKKVFLAPKPCLALNAGMRTPVGTGRVAATIDVKKVMAM